MAREGAKARRPVVPLHVHTQYSLLDGAASVKDAVEITASDGAPAMAITDHGTMAGVVQLVQEANKAGIKPIPGMEAYHVPDARVKSKVAQGKANYHLILLAQTNEGYRNLMKLHSRGYLEGRYGKYARIDDRMLSEGSKGIIATSGCLGSMVNQALLNGDEKQAKQFLSNHRDIFGKDNYYLEIQNHHIKDQLRILPDQVRIAREMGIPLLATNDSHYINQSDSEMHEALLALGTGTTLLDEDRFRFESNENHMRLSDEMYRLFPERDFPGAVSNTLLIAESVDLQVDVSGKNYWIPHFPLPNGFSSEAAYLRELTMKGAKRRYAEGDGSIPQQVIDRIDYELSVVHDMGFDGYFLIIWDLIAWAKNRDIVVGPGRGSAAGSIVAYCLNITTIDPLEHELYFERFLNPGRKSMPDVDIDFEVTRREEVRNYVVDRYGDDRVAQISTYASRKPKGSIRDAARVLGYPTAMGSELSGMYPEASQQNYAPINAILSDEPSSIWPDQWKQGRSLRSAYEDSSERREVLDLARSIESVINRRGIHPAAVLITPGPLWDYVPVKSGVQETSEIPVTAYDMTDVERLGGLKLDFLGLVNLSVMKYATDLIEKDFGKKIDLDNLPLDDEKVFRMLSEGDSDGVFQLESPGCRELLRRMKPTSFQDISATIALYRPGPMGTKMHNEFADRKNGRKPNNVLHEDMRELFSDTYGLMIYQEQLLKLVQHYAGFDGGQADNFRKATGKKDADVLAAQYDEFFAGMERNGHSPELAESLWEMILPFSAYSFNKAHAVAYGMISYSTAWLRVNYPAQYAAACIAHMPTDKISAQVESARSNGVEIYAPDVNRSDYTATTERSAVWLGLNGVSHCGPAAVQSIIDERNSGGKYTSPYDFIYRCRGRIKPDGFEHLIMAGALDNLHPSRKGLCDKLGEMLDLARSTNEVDEDDDDAFGLLDDDDLKTDFSFSDKDWDPVHRTQMEIAALGFPVGAHPFKLLGHLIPEAIERGMIHREAVVAGSFPPESGKQVRIYGTVSGLSSSSIKNGGKKYEFALEDGTGGSNDCITFGERPLANGQMVYISGVQDFDDRTERYVVRTKEIKIIDLSNLNIKQKSQEDLPEQRGPERISSRAPRIPGSTLGMQTTERAKTSISHSVVKTEEAESPSISARRPVRATRFGNKSKASQPTLPTQDSSQETIPDQILFQVKTSSQLQRLAGLLNPVREGQTLVLVEYRDTKMEIGSKTLTSQDAKVIASRSGATLS